MNLLQAKGFVLEARNYAEADKIIQLYTLSLGRIKAIAKGVRKPKSKLSSAIDLFTESSLSLHKRPSADLYLLTQAKVMDSHSDLKKDLKTITALQVLADLVSQSLHESEPHPEVYSLLQETLAGLGITGSEPEALLASFILKFLDLLGNPLELSACVECGTALQKQKATLIPHRGGALCGDCCPTGPARLKASPVELEILKKLRSLSMGKIHVLKMKRDFLRRIFLMALEYLERTIEKKLRSVDFYLKMVPLENPE